MSKLDYASYYIQEADKKRIGEMSGFLNVSASWFVRELFKSLSDEEILNKLGMGGRVADWKKEVKRGAKSQRKKSM